jgi:3,4-dihydroxy 2-butanone 4-phosphate synthase/GTP cyclohydrolase II
MKNKRLIETIRPFTIPSLLPVWLRPWDVVETNKKYLRKIDESLVVRLGSCPLPIRLHKQIPLRKQQLKKLNVEVKDETGSILLEKEVVYRMVVYGDKTTGAEHVAVIKTIGDRKAVPIRIHSSCLTSETFHASNCECHEQLELALQIIEKESYGGIIWLHQEGRGNGLAAKARQLTIMIEEGLPTTDAFEKAGYPKEQRDYSAAADILHDLRIKSVRLITNNPDKIKQIQEAGIKVIERIPCEITPFNDFVKNDLRAKKRQLGHKLKNV